MKHWNLVDCWRTSRFLIRDGNDAPKTGLSTKSPHCEMVWGKSMEKWVAICGRTKMGEILVIPFYELKESDHSMDTFFGGVNPQTGNNR